MALPGVTLSGKIETITGVADPGTVTITLQNYGSTAPIVSGTAQIAVVTKVIQAAGDGTWSTSLWGNDQIAPPNTYYTVVITTSDNVKVWSAAYVINSGGYDISMLSPMSAGLGVALPTNAIVANPVSPQRINAYSLTVPDLIAGGPVFDVRYFGAKCDGVTDDTTALNAAVTAALAVNGTVLIPSGKILAFSSTLTITSSKFAIRGGSGSVLKYTGTGTDAILLDGSAITNGISQVFLSDFAIDAPAATNALHTKKNGRSRFSNIEVRGCIGTAFLFEFSVSVTYDNLICSVNNAPFSHQPQVGIALANLLGNAGSDNTLINPIVEGVSVDGITIANVDGTTIIGGTSEGNTGRGVYISGNCQHSILMNMDIEANISGTDVELASSGQRHTRLLNCTIQNTLLIDGAPKETIVDGGLYGTITILAGALSTSITNGCAYGTLNDAGTNTQLVGLNAAIVNKLQQTQFVGSPLLSNDKPLYAFSSTGVQFPVVWWTAADQTLIQYLQGSALKIRNTNGTVALTVTDGGVVAAGSLSVGSASLLNPSGTNIGSLVVDTAANINANSLSANQTSTGDYAIPNVFRLGVNPTVNSTQYQMGLSEEAWIYATNTKTFSGIQTGVYGSFSHFGSGAATAIYGGSFEGFNAGSATVTQICGVNGNAWNGGVAAGAPVQTPTNNGSVTNLRGVQAFTSNKSSGIVTNAQGVYVNTATNTGGGSITTVVGVDIADQTAGGTNYALRTGAGFVKFNDTMLLTGHGNLPAAINGSLYMAAGYGSPIVGKVYVGDGSGWQLNFSKRTGSADTELFLFKDSGNLVASGSITAGSAGHVFTGATSGTTAVQASAAASGTLTLPAATDTLVGKATTDTLTNKTISGTLTLASQTLGIGNGVATNLTALAKSTGTGPASMAVVQWKQISVNGVTYYTPLFQ